MKKGLILFILFYTVSYLHAQKQLEVKEVVHSCLSSTITSSLYSENPSFEQMRFNIDDQILDNTLMVKNHLKLIEDQKTIPIVFHVIHPTGVAVGQGANITEERINNAVQQANDMFANTGDYYSPFGLDAGFRFCLAQIDENGNATNGINRLASDQYTNVQVATEEPDIKQNTLQWNPLQYLNVWVVNDVCYQANCSISGYSYQAEVHGSIYDGIVIQAENIGGNMELAKLFVHEIGHYLDLLHPFEGTCTNDNCLHDNDKVCDTPPENSQANHLCDEMPNSCSTDSNDTSTQNPFRPISLGGLGDQIDLINNYMDYGYLNCRNSFTPGQIERMHLSFNENRTSLLNSNGCSYGGSIELYVCSPPASTEVSSVDTENVHLNWSEVEDAGAYLVSIRAIGTTEVIEFTSLDTQINIGNLTPNSNYVYTVHSVCGINQSIDFTTGYFQTSVESIPCIAPASVNYSNVETNTVFVSWSAVNGANAYTAYLQKENEGWLSYPSDINSKYFNTLEPNTNYSFRVVSNCAGTVSAVSETIEFTTQPIQTIECISPTNMNVSYIDTNSAFVSWDSVAGVDSYVIAYKQGSATIYTYTYSDIAQISIVGLQDNTTYDVKIGSICGNETVLGSTIEQFTTLAEAVVPTCPTPTDLQAQNVGTNSAILNWNGSPTDADSYTVLVNAPNNTQTAYNASGSSLYINTFEDGSTYTFQVYAICAGISSEYSEIVTFHTEQAVVACNPPINVTLGEMDYASMSVQWDIVDNATSYQVSIRQFGESAWENYTTVKNNFVFSDLAPETSYVFIITTECGEVNSGAYYTGSFLTNSAPEQQINCTPPQQINISNVDTNSAYLSWDNTENAEQYFIFYKQNEENWSSHSTSNSFFTLENLQENTSYQVRLTANCASTSSVFSPIYDFQTTTMATTTPDDDNTDNSCNAPSNLLIGSPTTSSLTASWETVSDASFYIVGIRATNDENSWEFKIIANNNHTFDNLLENTAYNIKIRSMCNGFAGNFSEEITAYTANEIVIDVPDTSTTEETEPAAEVEAPIVEEDCVYPTNIGVINVENESATIYWESSKNADQYTLFLKEVGSTNTSVQNVNGSAFELTDLSPNTDYEVRLRATCGIQMSANSPVFSFKTTNTNDNQTQTECGIPQGLNIVTLGENMIQVSWDMQDNAIFYQAQLFKDGESEDIQTVSNNIATFNDVDINTSLTVRIRAYCNNQWSDYSDFMTITTVNETPSCGTVTNLTVDDIGDTYATLSWQTNESATYYELQVWAEDDNVIANYAVTNNYRDVSLLNNCTTYSWKVRPVCIGGQNEYSNVAFFNTLCNDDSACVSQGQSTNDGYISQVKIGDTGKLSGDNNGYADFTNNQFTVTIGNSNSFEMKASTNDPFYWGIWLDINNDGEFDEFYERLYLSTTPRYGSCAGFITIPTDADVQTTQMRVIMSSQSNIDPCSDFESGETEDFTIKIED